MLMNFVTFNKVLPSFRRRDITSKYVEIAMRYGRLEAVGALGRWPGRRYRLVHMWGRTSDWPERTVAASPGRTVSSGVCFGPAFSAGAFFKGTESTGANTGSPCSVRRARRPPYGVPSYGVTNKPAENIRHEKTGRTPHGTRHRSHKSLFGCKNPQARIFGPHQAP